MVIERYDKRSDPRIEEIQRDWMAWATSNGYLRIESLPIEYEGTKITLEIWENAVQEDRYLLYFPRLPHIGGDGGEKLFITGQDDFTFLRDSVERMAKAAIILAVEKWKINQDQKASLN